MSHPALRLMRLIIPAPVLSLLSLEVKVDTGWVTHSHQQGPCLCQGPGANLAFAMSGQLLTQQDKTEQYKKWA